KRGSIRRPTVRSASQRAPAPEATSSPREARTAMRRDIGGSAVLPLAVLVDLGRRARGMERPRRPPAPLDAVRAGGRGVVAAHVLLAQLSHALAVPGGEHAVLHVPERRLHVVVALAGHERAVPEDVAVVPEVRARTANGRFV